MSQTPLVARLEQPGTKAPVNLNSGSDDGPRDHINAFLCVLCVSAVNHHRSVASQGLSTQPDTPEPNPPHAGLYSPQTSRSASLISPSVARDRTASRIGGM